MEDNMKQRKKDTHDKLDTANNSSMAQDLDEIKKLGKEMNNAKTGTELEEEENLTPDPKQQRNDQSTGPNAGSLLFVLNKQLLK